MSPKLHLLCVFLVLSIQGVYPGPANNNVDQAIVADAKYVLGEVGKVWGMVTADTALAGMGPESFKPVISDFLKVAKAWVRMLTKNVETSYKAMRCFREAVIKAVDKSETVIKSFFECKLQMLTLTENELKTWTNNAQTYLTSFSKQLKESLTMLENCANDANMYACTKKNLFDMYTKVKSKLQVLPTTLINPGWAIAQHIATSAWDCKTSKWKEMVAAYNELRDGVNTCYKTHIGGNVSLVLGA